MLKANHCMPRVQLCYIVQIVALQQSISTVHCCEAQQCRRFLTSPLRGKVQNASPTSYITSIRRLSTPQTMSRVTPTTPPSASSSQPPSSSEPQASSSQPQEESYPIKWVLNSSQISIPVVMQSSNGPCALLALANALLVTGTLKLPQGTTTLPESHLMSLLAEHASSQPLPSENHAHILEEFLDLLPTLSKGLHINVKFTDTSAFEFTKELSAFDILKVQLLHGWLVDPQDAPLAAALSNLSYNQVLNELVRTASPDAGEASAPPEDAFDGDAPVVQESDATVRIRELRPCVLEFFEGNPTMLTIYGLAALHQTMREGETAVLFRNSHFYVLLKKGGELFTLITDVGYLNELNTVWEKLIDVTGDSVFYTGGFKRIGENGQVVGISSSAAATTSGSAGARPMTNGRVPTAGSSSAPAARTGTPAARTGTPVAANRSSRSRTSSKSSSEKCVIQ